jgi:hypothetical protein
MRSPNFVIGQPASQYEIARAAHPRQRRAFEFGMRLACDNELDLPV